MESGKEIDLVPLLQNLKLGNEAAFNTLYRIHSKLLLSNIKRLVKDNEIAKELLQDLYVRVWEHRESIDIQKSYKSFLFTISRNLVFDYLRRKALDKRAQITLVQNAIEFYSPIEEDLDYRESNELINLAIENLAVQSKQVFKMSRLCGKTHQQIAEELGMSLKMVNYHITKANKEVKASLLKHNDKMALFFITITLWNIK